MLTGKFLQIRKVFAASSLLAEEFLDNMENVQMLYTNIQIICKVSGLSGKCLDNLKSVWMILKVSGQSKKCPDDLENVSP